MLPPIKAAVDAAHPRVSGENKASGVNLDQVHGSSPRERGKPPPHESHMQILGLIPA